MVSFVKNSPCDPKKKPEEKWHYIIVYKYDLILHTLMVRCIKVPYNTAFLESYEYENWGTC